MAAKRQPWFKFYGRDWRVNPKLRRCSPASRGIWADLMTLMDEAPHRGFLLTEDGLAMDAADLGRLIGTELKEVKRALFELGDKHVYSIVGQLMPEDVQRLIPGDIPEGVILSRRMVRDAAKALMNRDNGRGGGNPSLKPRVNPGGYRSEIRDQRSESQGSSIGTDAARASASPDGPPRSQSPLSLTGPNTIWKVRLTGHVPGAAWKPEFGAAPESAEDNPNLDADQRRQWRHYFGLSPNWKTEQAAA